MAFHHVTVLRDEAAALLAPVPGRRVLDGTLGGGGHSEAMLERGARVVGLDQDGRALEAARGRLARFGDRFVAVHANFRDARAALDGLGVDRVDGALVDLGVSSPQLDEGDRGFSFSKGGPLDMRMDASRGEPLSERLAGVDLGELERVVREYGEEPFARPVARAILRARDEGRLTDTRALAEVVSRAIPAAKWPKAVHPATRTFQALRIWVNDELGALDAWLAALPDLVAPGGRAAAIAFHSLEDRPVKRRFAQLCTGCVCPPDLPVCGCGRRPQWRLVTRQPVTASDAEVAANPRARSAHLRCIERLEAQ
jgi:16S rRNA (cytosine1402-N4)-methyltransferase